MVQSPLTHIVKTNVAKYFLKLVDKHFPKNHNLHKIFNRNNLKVSYSCMKNVKSIIQGHNSQLLAKMDSTAPPTRECNCRNKTSCPLSGKCLSTAIVYRAEVNCDNDTFSYIGLTGGTFKMRYNNHTKSFRHKTHSNDTELSKFIWQLKDKEKEFSISWSIVKQSNTRMNASGICNLCLAEKTAIIQASKQNLLNKRSEIVSTCRHNAQKRPLNRARKK